MAIDSSGPGNGAVSSLRDTIGVLRNPGTSNRVGPPPDAPEPARDEPSVTLSRSATTDPRLVERRELDTIRQGLSGALAAGNVALAGARSASDTLDEIGTRLRELGDGNPAPERRAALAAEVESLVAQGLETVDRAGFDGVNLLDADRDRDLEVTADRDGGTERVRDQDLRTAFESLQGLDLSGAENARAALDTVFAEARTTADTAVRELADDTGRIGQRIAAIEERQGELAGADQDVDAGLDADAAQQLAQQLQQSLRGQGLGIVNQRPETLVGLFR